MLKGGGKLRARPNIPPKTIPIKKGEGGVRGEEGRVVSGGGEDLPIP